MDTIGGIYHVKCDNCEMDSIRVTERSASDRFPENHRKCMIEKPPIAHHVCYNNHIISTHVIHLYFYTCNTPVFLHM